MSEWQRMDTAPRDGTEFVWVRRITVLEVGKPATYRYEAHAMRRCWLEDEVGRPREGSGFWMAQYGSVADIDASGMWAPLPASMDPGPP